MRKFKNLLKKILPKILLNKRIEYFSTRKKASYSQTGEDILIDFLLSNNKTNKKNGFYVDIGAHHPTIMSNTKYFYKKGWHGINIDVMPGSMKKFNKQRKRDINIESAISDTDDEYDLYIFKDRAINTLSKESADESVLNGKKIEKIIKIKTKKIGDILAQNILNSTHIDFMSIDVEGFDINVLRSNDWNKYRPTFILIECAQFNIENPGESEIYNYLHELNYRMISKINVNLLFEDKNNHQ